MALVYMQERCLLMLLFEDKWFMLFPANTVELQEAVLYELHTSALGGHIGCRKLQALAKYQLYWPLLFFNCHIQIVIGRV